MSFSPRRVIFERMALEYPLGRKLWDNFSRRSSIEVRLLRPGQKVTGIRGLTPREAYREAKRTLVVGVRKNLEFQSCKPSAHFQLPLVSGCIGECEYCYLNTRKGEKPYVRVYVNLDEILDQAERYIEQREPELTIFEGAATSDPVPVEPLTSALAAAVMFFARHEYGRFRFVTKYTDIDSLIHIDHRKHTTVRFSINAERVIKTYEHGTPGLDHRLKAAARVAKAGYPLGFIVGPVILFSGWETEYQLVFERLVPLVKESSEPVHFEIISHRFTARAKKSIENIFPETSLPMDEEQRVFKFGQFGYGKYVYPPDKLEAIRRFFSDAFQRHLPNAVIDYII